MPSLASEMGQNSCSAEWVIYMEKAIEKVFTFEQGRKKKKNPKNFSISVFLCHREVRIYT